MSSSLFTVHSGHLTDQTTNKHGKELIQVSRMCKSSPVPFVQLNSIWPPRCEVAQLCSKIFTSLKQKNLFNIQSKQSEFFKSTSCVLGRIKILMLHFLAFFCVKMHDFCVNAIPVIIFRSFLVYINISVQYIRFAFRNRVEK